MNEPFQLYHGDCLEVLKTLPDNSVDSLITDPPSGIAFMNQEWDTNKGSPEQWRAWLADVMREALRVLKPGAHGLVWSLPRTSYWTAMALETAGFEIRDCVAHIFGSGFPKNHNIPLAIDKHLRVDPEVVGQRVQTGAKFKVTQQTIDNGGFNDPDRDTFNLTGPASDEAKQWEGWGTALKPAREDWWLVRKPLDGTIAENVLAHGTGGLNLDACRIETNDTWSRSAGFTPAHQGYGTGAFTNKNAGQMNEAGRWPSHLLLTHSQACGLYCAEDCPVREIGEEARFFKIFDYDFTLEAKPLFYYCAKPSVAEKEEGLEGFGVGALRDGGRGSFEPQKVNDGRETPIDNAYQRGETLRRNIHPTVKAQALMTYLIKLITPKGGTVLDCFMGSGSTGVAAVNGKWRFIGIEMNPAKEGDPNFFGIAEARIRSAHTAPQQQSLFDTQETSA